MCLTLFTFGTFFYVKATGVDVTAFGWIPLMSLIVYVIGFSLGFGPIPWLMMGEILPVKIRGSAASVATAFQLELHVHRHEDIRRHCFGDWTVRHFLDVRYDRSSWFRLRNRQRTRNAR